MSRRSGRTVKMLAQALAAAVQGERVVIVAHEKRYADDLVRTVRRAALALGVEAQYVRVEGATMDHDRRGVGDKRFFVDHFVKETRYSHAWRDLVPTE